MAANKPTPVQRQNDGFKKRRLSHPNIVRFMAAAKTESLVLIANEYIHGASLHTVLHGSENSVMLDADEKNYVALEISMAVEYIHSKNIIHQDLKPANIIIEETRKKAYLTDWGMANIRDTVLLKRGSKIFQCLVDLSEEPLFIWLRNVF
ncbi:serine/threonine-protein kinase STY13-like [Bufo bufo]|uniref:serine/threonine-protein kinase STY13-like n=1 Tax=Bufo bufo TaxID=8384 RepID=UPI001ABE7172|nr:serine/threonine-protein kinase STY13-like [Bufo bufo]